MHEEAGGMSGDPHASPHGEEAYAWLKRGDGDTATPILYTTAVRVGEDPWRDIVLARELESLAEEQATAARARDENEGGHVVLVTDLVVEPESRVRAAIALAGLWAERGLRVVLVDADLRYVGLARHLDEDSADAEGFVDALEYGASGPPLLRATPLPDVRVLPLGSYRPDHTQPLSDEALRRLVRQLRSVADVVILLSPAWTAEGRFHPLLVHSDAVVLSFDLDRSLAEALGELRRYLDGLGIPMAAMAVRVGSDPESRAVDVALSSSSADESGSREQPATTSSPYADLAGRDEGDGSSPLVRNSLTALVVVLLAFVGWWAWTEFSAREEAGPALDVARLSPPSGKADVDQPPASPAVVADSVEAAHDSVRVDDSGPSSPVGDDPEAVTELAAEASSTEEPVETAMEKAPGGVSGHVASNVPEEVPEEVPDELPEKSPEVVTTPALPAELFLAPRAGWALHPWSFADSTDAAAALRSLERESMHPVVRGATIKGSVWYRVLVGNFSTRADAWQARDALASKVRTDWIGVVRVTE